jgi:hypothetical protein
MRRHGACIVYLIGAPFTGLLGAICSIRDVEQHKGSVAMMNRINHIYIDIVS